MDVREKLVELIESARYWGSNTSEEIAENLIAHGVTVQEKITHGKWVSNGIPESILSACSVCGFPCGASTFNYCPQCGAMMDK